MNMEAIKKQAELELAAEDFNVAVEKYKVKLRSKKTVWDRVWPFKIIILRKDV